MSRPSTWATIDEGNIQGADRILLSVDPVEEPKSRTISFDALTLAIAQKLALETAFAGTDGGTGDVRTLTVPIEISDLQPHMKFQVISSAANTDATTMNINSLGAKDIKKKSGTSLAALAANDLIAGQVYEIVYDGTQFQLL